MCQASVRAFAASQRSALASLGQQLREERAAEAEKLRQQVAKDAEAQAARAEELQRQVVSRVRALDGVLC